MALPATTVLEVSALGADTNGGGFDSSGTGTDYSQQNTKNMVGNNISTTDAVANGTTTITSATAAFTSAIEGNIIYLQGGSGSLAASWRRATFVNSTTITVDATVASGTGITLNIGGRLSTLTKAAALVVAGSIVWCKADQTVVITANISINVAGTSALPIDWRGYTTTRGDGGPFAVSIQSGSGITMFNCSVALNRFRWFTLDANSKATSTCVALGGIGAHIQDCTVKDFTTAGVKFTSNDSSSQNVLATAGTSAATAGFQLAARAWITDCYSVSNACPGFATSANVAAMLVRCIAANNSGASSDGFQCTVATQQMWNMVDCLSHTNGRDGLRFTAAASTDIAHVRGCVFVNNSGYGINSATTSWSSVTLDLDYNFFYNNTSGARNNVAAGTRDVPLTGDPCNNAAGNDFSPNNTPGAGALVRGTNFPGVCFGLSTTGYRDGGPIQHRDAGPFGSMIGSQQAVNRAGVY